MIDKTYTRREAVQKALQLGSVLAGFGFVSGCSSEDDLSGEAEQISSVDSCDDVSDVSQSEVDKRDVYGYVEESPYPDMVCENCSLFIPREEGSACGGCVLFDGPVFDDGYCDYWEPLA